MDRTREHLTEYIKHISSRDAELDHEIKDTLRREARPEWLGEAVTALASAVNEPLGRPRGLSELVPGYGNVEPETIVLRMARPVVSVVGGAAQLEFHDTESETWKGRLEKAAGVLAPAIASIGRVEVTNHPSGLDYMGTGWVIDDGVIVTNRHVALSFAASNGDEFAFLTGFDRTNPIGVDIDFLEEIGNLQQRAARISRVLYIAKETEPDVAFLLLDPAASAMKLRPIPLVSSLLPVDTQVAIVGYPARDSRVPDAALMDRIFGKVYDKKRLAPGLTTGFERASIRHDCTTLGGNSGSPLVDLVSGEVCGLHYSGVFLEGNYAVPSPVVAKLLAEQRGSGGRVIPRSTARLDTVAGTQATLAAASGNELRVTIPIEVTVTVGASQPAATAATSPRVGPLLPPSTTDVEAAVEEAKRLYGQRPDVVKIEAGWQFSDGWITDHRAVVFAVKTKLAPEALRARGVVSLPEKILGVPVDIRVATLEEIAPELDLEARTSQWRSTYERLADEAALLAEVDEEMKVTVHASPDAGWPVLADFLAATRQRLTIGMYDFTAPHIVDAIADATSGARRELNLVLQHGESLGTGTKKDDIPEEATIADFTAALDDRFTHAWAVTTGQASPFKSAYHIKVAVRDGSAFWLSSGNWQSSNQPAADPINDADTQPPLLKAYNREWHAVVEHEQLAASFERYLLHDLEQARAAPAEEAPVPEVMVWVPAGFFQPTEAELEARPSYTPPLTVDRRVRVQPLLTPDNYARHVLALIESARRRVYFQNQSLRILEDNPEHYQRLLDALRARQRAGLDVRIVIRNLDAREAVTRMRDFGFDTDQVRLQTNCHTKGIVVDSETVLLGSQNWTADGTGPNRDASLIFFDPEIAAYFERLFLYDWNRIGRPRIDESLPTPELAQPGDLTPHPGMVLVPLERYLGEG